MRINKYIAANSKYSRRNVDELLKLGKIFVNGKKAEIGTIINPNKDEIKILGQKVRISNTKIYLLLNKPKGYITTRKDELERETVMSLVPKIQNLKPAGRLDKDSEGLLIMSNDGDFINKLTHPKFECTKEYFVKIKGILNNEEITKIEHGIKIDGKKTAEAKIRIIKTHNEETILTIKIHEGRNRQIRKMFASLGHDVKYLQRTAIGKIKINNLKTGTYRTLTKQEINAFK